MRVLAVAIALVGFLVLGCTPPLVEQIRAQCANAPDRQKCEDDAYARAYAEERYRNRRIGGD